MPRALADAMQLSAHGADLPRVVSQLRSAGLGYREALTAGRAIESDVRIRRSRNRRLRTRTFGLVALHLFVITVMTALELTISPVVSVIVLALSIVRGWTLIRAVPPRQSVTVSEE